VYFQSQQNAFSKHSLHTAGYFQSQQNAFSKHSLHPAGYFQSQQHAIHSPNIHYSVGVFSITTACHSFSKCSLHWAGYFQSQQHVIHSPNAHYTRRGIFNHNSMPFILQLLITPGGIFSITTACHSFSKRFLSCRRQNNFALHKILLYISKFSIKMKTNKQQQQKAKQKNKQI
jgi:hypothetical protein